MAILTAECDRIFSVDPEQSKRFKSLEADEKKRSKAEITLSKISQKIKVEGKPETNDKP